MSLISYCCRTIGFFVMAAVLFGCQKAEQIQSYTAPKDPPPPAIASEAAATRTTTPAAAEGKSAAPTDRMLVAIVPDGEQAWFFKVVGPASAIDSQEKAITDFFATIRPGGDRSLPSWKLPKGWSERPGSMMRLVTITIPSADDPLELAVTSLGWTGQPDDVLQNVNRWRGQMQLPPIGQSQIGESLRELKAGDNSYTIVDLRGRFQSTGTMAPFAGRGPFAGGLPPGGIAGGGNPPPPGTENELPAGHPPIDPAAGIPTDADASSAISRESPDTAAVPKFEAPPSWKPVPAVGMRRAEFDITDGDKSAEVTLIDFPAQAGPMIADPLANVNRWRGEIGLDQLQPDALDVNIEKIEVDGQPATYAAIIANAAPAAQATLGAIVPSGDRVWFFKLKGDRDLVVAEQERFKDFVKSVRFAADRGAPDGN